ncbi:hypothetical protein [Allocoleopsis franciscana]|uniref:Uncharacterized protein n=1 Tax=Allocoleopsis franciscana PCC 7113 TaxID=1173027 RepID=K9WHK7_9CYAN|nr:hypothetical protein [Allocoleopsis franciscana]AFZ19259.1 hypothetical protein Mic7113_3535 [Allocoleopsis franciscana PCC 7113]
MCLAKTYDIHLELAVDVFKSQNPALIISLKNFLTVLPNPQCVEDVLMAAIYMLAKTEPEACRWILRNSYYLKPEVDLVEFTSNLALTKLQNQGFLLNQDFNFEPNRHLQVTEQAKAGLMVDNSDGDRLLLEEILQIRDSTPAL